MSSNENNLLYDVINTQTNQTIFYYCVLFIIVLMIYPYVEISFSLFVLLIVYCIYVSYYTTYNNINDINNEEKFNIKSKTTTISEKYKDIIDFLFYLESFKIFSYMLYEETEILIKNFTIIYENCINDYKLINDYYNTL